MVIKGTRARGCYVSNVANERETSGPVAEVSSMGSEDVLRASAHPGRERHPAGANGTQYRTLQRPRGEAGSGSMSSRVGGIPGKTKVYNSEEY